MFEHFVALLMLISYIYVANEPFSHTNLHTYNFFYHSYILIHVALLFLDSTKSTTANRRTRETVENNDRTTTENERESSEDTKRRSIIASTRLRSLSSAFLDRRRRSPDANKLWRHSIPIKDKLKIKKWEDWLNRKRPKSMFLLYSEWYKVIRVATRECPKCYTH